jgi:hypothetical protein
MGSGCAIDNLTNGEHGVKAAEVGGGSKAICASADTHFNDKGPKRQWDNLDNGLLVVISLPSSQTLSPGLKTGAGSHRRL